MLALKSKINMTKMTAQPKYRLSATIRKENVFSFEKYRKCLERRTYQDSGSSPEDRNVSSLEGKKIRKLMPQENSRNKGMYEIENHLTNISAYTCALRLSLKPEIIRIADAPADRNIFLDNSNKKFDKTAAVQDVTIAEPEISLFDYMEQKMFPSLKNLELFGTDTYCSGSSLKESNESSLKSKKLRELMSQENFRIASMMHLTSSLNVQEMAEAGLYLEEGSVDVIKCYKCELAIPRDEWPKGEDPVKVHKMFFPDCPLFCTDLVDDFQDQPRAGGISEAMGSKKKCRQKKQTSKTRFWDLKDSLSVLEIANFSSHENPQLHSFKRPKLLLPYCPFVCIDLVQDMAGNINETSRSKKPAEEETSETMQKHDFDVEGSQFTLYISNISSNCSASDLSNLSSNVSSNSSVTVSYNVPSLEGKRGSQCILEIVNTSSNFSSQSRLDISNVSSDASSNVLSNISNFSSNVSSNVSSLEETNQRERMHQENVRIASMIHLESSLNIQEMAKEGLYLEEGSVDFFRCYKCDLLIARDEWQLEEDPAKVHKMSFPSCPLCCTDDF